MLIGYTLSMAIASSNFCGPNRDAFQLQPTTTSTNSRLFIQVTANDSFRLAICDEAVRALRDRSET